MSGYKLFLSFILFHPSLSHKQSYLILSYLILSYTSNILSSADLFPPRFQTRVGKTSSSMAYVQSTLAIPDLAIADPLLYRTDERLQHFILANFLLLYRTVIHIIPYRTQRKGFLTPVPLQFSLAIPDENMSANNSLC